MLKYSAIFLIFFIGMTSCLELQSAAASGVILPSIQSKSQLVELLVQVRSEKSFNTIGYIVKEIQQELTNLVNTQAKHKKIHAKMMKQCISEGKFRRSEIKKAKGALGRATAHLQKCKASLGTAQKELPGLVSTFNTYRKELQRAQKQRDVENKKYRQRKSELTQALSFLIQFLGYVNKGLSNIKSVSLVDISENLLKHANKLNLLTAAAPVLVEIAQSYKFAVNSQLKAKLLNALNSLIAKIKNELSTDEIIEKKAQAVFNKYKLRLDKVINTLARNIKRVKKQIKDMKRCIDIEGGIISSSLRKIARNTHLLNVAESMCKSFNAEFIQATYNRLDEIKTMNAIIKIVSKRVKKLPKDLISYLEEVKNGFKAYVNSTKFKKFIEYERKKYLVNKRGALLAKLNAKKDKNPLSAHIKGAKGIY